MIQHRRSLVLSVFHSPVFSASIFGVGLSLPGIALSLYKLRDWFGIPHKGTCILSIPFFVSGGNEISLLTVDRQVKL